SCSQIPMQPPSRSLVGQLQLLPPHIRDVLYPPPAPTQIYTLSLHDALPISATDAKIRKAFAEKIPGTTKIIIAQRVSSVEGADRILVLDNGRVNAFDTHDKIGRASCRERV